MKYILLNAFVKQYDKYEKEKQEMIVSSIERIKEYIETNTAPYGLRIKKLSQRIYEARVSIDIRILFYREDAIVKYFCLGNHNDVVRCLKSFR